MNKTASALLAASFSWAALAACGEKHDVLGSRTDTGGSEAGRGGSDGAGKGGSATGGTATAGATSGGAGRSGGDAGRGTGGTAVAGNPGSGGEAGTTGGATGGSGAASGSGTGAASGEAGAPGAGSDGGTGEGGGSSGAAGAGTAGTGGAAPVCPTDCTVATTGCSSGQVSWLCGNNHDYQELIDAGCTDQATGLPRYCCPPEFYAGCGTCDRATTLEACEALPNCHSVFSDPGPESCACTAEGCCAEFSFCADGAFADCDGPAACASLTPYCDDPAYVLSYANACFEGCVKPEDCEAQSAATTSSRRIDPSARFRE